VLLGLFAALTLGASANASAAWDEPIHLTAGYVALVSGDYRIDPSHPPLLRMWAALPLLLSDPGVDTGIVDASTPEAWLGKAYGFAHQFMYVANDADRMLAAARVMVALLAVALGVLVFCWARDWLGPAPAIGALALFVLEPNLLAHASLVTTDLGLTTFYFGTAYFLWKTCERPTLARALGAACCGGLAAATKFSAILLAPAAIVLLLVAVSRRTMTIRAAGAVAGLMIATAIAVVWMIYGFRYLPSESSGWAFDFADASLVRDHPAMTAAAAWVDRHHLLPNAYTQGFLYTNASAQAMPSFLAGERSDSGWWHYFPFAFLIKTPIALLLLTIAGVGVCAARFRVLGPMPLACIGVPVAVYFGAAMASGINVGLRHILPVYPFVLLVAAAAVKALLATKRRWAPLALTVVLAAGAAELARAYPHPLVFFNQLAGGPSNGFKYLADSNLGWGTDLRGLKAWMDRRGVAHINLAYFGQADPAYYRIDATHLPGAPGFATDRIARPRLPGYVAISPTILQGVYSPPQWQLFYRPFIALEPAAVIGHSLRVYWVERWPDAPFAANDAGGRSEGAPILIDAHRTLADALLLGMQWPEAAVPRYREYVQHRPDDPDALMHLGIALVGSGHVHEAMPVFRAAVDAGPRHGAARLTLAKALFGSRDVAGARMHAEHAARLLPDDPGAHDFLGRVLAAQGRFDDARQHFHRALAIDPSHAEAREHAARLAAAR
jgi:tetratricopeptide (TPR) repeat protein